jgi:hypothetical protein
MRPIRYWLVLLALGTACGGAGDGAAGHVTKADLIKALRAGTDQKTAECVADGLLAAGLRDDQLREFANFSGDKELPSQIGVYTAARQACDASR